MIYDAFQFFNELDTLEIRLHELAGVVDRFVIVESRETHNFQSKPLHFADNRERFAPFLDRIIHLVVDRFPRGGDPLASDFYQRDFLAQGLKDVGADDIVILSDLDEIPNTAVLVPTIAADGPVALGQRLFVGYLNAECINLASWTKSKVMRGRHISGSLTALRLATHPIIPRAGWHFTFLGGVPQIRHKIESYAHQELNRRRFKSERNITRAFRAGRAPFDAKLRLREVPIDATFPRYVRENQDRLKHFIAPPGLIGSDPLAALILSLTHRYERAAMRALVGAAKIRRVMRVG